MPDSFPSFSALDGSPRSTADTATADEMNGVEAVLGENHHGKDKVRVAKVRRGRDGVHQFVEFVVRIELYGGAEASYTHGHNSAVVATDTCKNHVYMLAKTHDCATPEEFAIDLSLTFLKAYAHVRSAAIAVTEIPWKRVSLNGSDHKHGFIKHSEGSRIAKAVGTKVLKQYAPEVQLSSSLTGYVLLACMSSHFLAATGACRDSRVDMRSALGSNSDLVCLVSLVLALQARCSENDSVWLGKFPF